MQDEQYKLLLEETRKNREATEKLEAKWERDRQDFADFRVELEQVKAELAEFRRSLNNLPVYIKEQVNKLLEPVISSTDALEKTIEGKKVLAFKKGLSWWRRILNRFKNEKNSTNSK